MGSKEFRTNLQVTSAFFFVRLVFSLLIAVIYIIVAAMIQYYFVRFVGESTFNYIIGGLLSLFLGIIICKVLSSLLFMFVRGWHVAALAYTPKIIRAKVSALSVGMNAFSKNIVTFSAIYGIKVITNNIASMFKDKLWDFIEDVPGSNVLHRFSEHPIVGVISSDILHYSFDAVVFYVIKYPSESVEDLPEVMLTAMKKYLYCLPSILFASMQAYIAFRVIPTVLKLIIVFWLLFSQGLVSSVLISVLLYPLYFLLDAVIFEPLTMILFITVYSKHCNDDLDSENPIVQFVEDILKDNALGTGESENTQEPDDAIKTTEKPKQKKLRDTVDATEVEESVSEEAPVEQELDKEILNSLINLSSQYDSSEEIPRVRPNTAKEVPLVESDSTIEDLYPPLNDIANLFRDFRDDDLDADPLYADEDETTLTDRAQNILSGEDD